MIEAEQDFRGCAQTVVFATATQTAPQVAQLMFASVGPAAPPVAQSMTARSRGNSEAGLRELRGPLTLWHRTIAGHDESGGE